MGLDTPLKNTKNLTPPKKYQLHVLCRSAFLADKKNLGAACIPGYAAHANSCAFWLQMHQHRELLGFLRTRVLLVAKSSDVLHIL